MQNAIFLTHKNTLGFENSITGGVQLCSQEYFKLLISIKINLKPYYVNYTNRISDRILIKLKLDCYNMFNIKKDQNDLINYIKENNVKFVFINLASLLRYAKPIKECFKSDVKVLLLSHGNDSGDFLHATTKPIKKYNFFAKNRDVFRLGRLLHAESYYRINFLDGVFTVSAVEEQIEKWLGAKNIVFTPRTINKTYKLDLKTNYSKAGFIGRLDHSPNLQGFEMLCTAIKKDIANTNLELSLIGAPIEIGKYFENKYPFVSYKGELLDSELEQEVATWALFLNPVFWYSMGVTTKIAKAIEWGIPVITTLYGLRGYEWSNGNMVLVKNESEMSKSLLSYINHPTLVEDLKKEMLKIKNSSPTMDELAIKLESVLLQNLQNS